MGNTTRKEVAKASTEALQRAIKEGKGFILLIDGDDDKHYSKQVHMLPQTQQLNMLLSAMKSCDMYQAIQAADNVGEILGGMIDGNNAEDEIDEVEDDLPAEMPDELKKIINELRGLGANIKVSTKSGDKKPVGDRVDGGDLTQEKIDEFLSQLSENYNDDNFSSVVMTMTKEKDGVRVTTAINASPAQAGDMIDTLLTEEPAIGRYLGGKKLSDLVDKISKK